MKRDLLILSILVATLAGWLVWQTREPATPTGQLSLGNVLGGSGEGFRRVTGPIPFDFPRDHGSHPEYQNEWWYFVGNLAAPTGERFGFQFTLFRFALDSGPALDSDWQTDQVWMAHLAMSDAGGERFFQQERFARGALGLAGATEERWWLRDWSVEATDQGWQLDLQTDDFGLELDLALTRPLVFQGDAGYSRKGPDPGNASRYYSATRLAASGRLRTEPRGLDAQWVEVDGLAWLDREWGSGQLADDVSGWDWFSLQLDDGRDLMVYRLRHPDGSATRFSAGALVSADGQTARILGHEDFRTTPLRWWRDDQGIRWPLAWRIELADEGIDWQVDAVFDQQRWTASVPYWEGMVTVREYQQPEIIGRGYMELSGYAD
ncbi:MAG: lipocalin-like domain-containing protein [Wenzhouxiangella sp.]